MSITIMGVVTKHETITCFGHLIEYYRTRKGLSQKAFARSMEYAGYPNYSQRTHSHLLYHPAARVYPFFFQLVGEICDLSLSEQQALWASWLELTELSLSSREGGPKKEQEDTSGNE